MIALTKKIRQNGRYTRIDSIQWSENPVQGWVKGREFPVIFHRQVFTNKDDSTGTLYLISNDLSATAAPPLKQSTKNGWKVEVFHKSIKSNTSMAKSPARTVRTQSNPYLHVALCDCSIRDSQCPARAEQVRFKIETLYNAIRQAFDELQQLKSAVLRNISY